MTKDGWTADRAYGEMKQFNFEGFPGHPTLKNVVFDYRTQADCASPPPGLRWALISPWP
jgi:hypothetical protein